MSDPDIGGELTRAREGRGLTLEDAERDTRISQRYLQALEDERFDVIPAPVYARGFLSSNSTTSARRLSEGRAAAAAAPEGVGEPLAFRRVTASRPPAHRRQKRSKSGA